MGRVLVKELLHVFPGILVACIPGIAAAFLFLLRAWKGVYVWCGCMDIVWDTQTTYNCNVTTCKVLVITSSWFCFVFQSCRLNLVSAHEEEWWLLHEGTPLQLFYFAVMVSIARSYSLEVGFTLGNGYTEPASWVFIHPPFSPSCLLYLHVDRSDPHTHC